MLWRYLQNNTDVCLILNFLCNMHIFKIWASKFYYVRKLQIEYLEFWKPNIKMVGLQWKNETLLSSFKAIKAPVWIKLLLTGLKKHPVEWTQPRINTGVLFCWVFGTFQGLVCSWSRHNSWGLWCWYSAGGNLDGMLVFSNHSGNSAGLELHASLITRSLFFLFSGHWFKWLILNRLYFGLISLHL